MSGASLAVVRVALGVVAAASAVRTLTYGWADSLYSRPSHRFTYLGLDWVPQPGPAGIRVLLGCVFLAGIGLIVGRAHRWFAALLLVSFGWVEAIDATTYLNHYWFVTLMAALAVVAPLSSKEPVAAVWVWLVRFQVAVVYSFAGLAKLQPDWLIHALPLRMWLPARADLPVVGPLMELPATAHLFAVAGALYDCLVVAGLLWRRSRPFAWAAVVAFHVSTWILFPIGVFPWLMIAVSTVFWEPDWPARFRDRLILLGHRFGIAPNSPPPSTPAVAARSGATALELLRRHDVTSRSRSTGLNRSSATSPTSTPKGTDAVPVSRWAFGLAVTWAAIQVALPLRHLAYPGDHRWTAEGYRFGWNVLLVERSGSVAFEVYEPSTGHRWTADAEALYTPNQVRVMNGEPDLIQQAAREIRSAEAEKGHRVEVHVDAWMSFNGRPAQRWIDPTVDLAAQPRNLWPKPWILPRP
ncbi:MAG: HTTM domain-containing protein [Microthrixaceae bacterium]|nr:HTTM domain-containing protein [Acidimicrobiales bacterium]MCB9404780.1 HTTM domain-containing protein [Microthrixaceae bacterium]